MANLEISAEEVQILFELVFNTPAKGPGKKVLIELEDKLKKVGARENLENRYDAK